MITVRTVYELINAIAPFETQLDYDNSGLLIGGMDRHIDYDVLVGFIREHGELDYIFMYESGYRIYEDVKQYPNCVAVADLKAAVAEAKSRTPVGKACILSPAAASYGYFKNFEERGDVFAKLALGNS